MRLVDPEDVKIALYPFQAEHELKPPVLRSIQQPRKQLRALLERAGVLRHGELQAQQGPQELQLKEQVHQAVLVIQRAVDRADQVVADPEEGKLPFLQPDLLQEEERGESIGKLPEDFH